MYRVPSSPSTKGKITMSIQETALELTKKICDFGILGMGGALSTSRSLAQEYLDDPSYASATERAESLIRWETSKNFTSGFLTGLGGLITLPITLPAGMGAAWILQARMVGAIAEIYGHSSEEERVQTLILLVLLGDAGKEILKEMGIQIGTKVAFSLLRKLPGKILIEINKKVGFRLLTKAGERGVINLVKFLPLVGGIVGGTVDAIACQATGHLAISSFGTE